MRSVLPQYFCTALLCGSILSGRITSREIPLQFVKFPCGSRVGLVTLAGTERRYALCVGLGVLVGNGWVEDAAGIGGRRQSRWRSLLPAALLSLNLCFGGPIIDSETWATFFCVEEDHASVNPWPPQRQCFWVINGRSETEGYRFFCRQSFWPYRCLLRGLVLACQASRNPALEAAFTPAASSFWCVATTAGHGVVCGA